MMCKSELRAAMRAQRRSLSPSERIRAGVSVSSQVIERCAAANVVAVYLASPDEIDIDFAITELLACGKVVVAPRWTGSEYVLARLTGLSSGDIRLGPMSIREPAEENPVSPENVDVWIVPGLAFTRKGDRLGYGGGWYDRLLPAASPEALKLGVAHRFQIVSEIDAEAHDCCLDGVVIA